jgi:hypothetical protein
MNDWKIGDRFQDLNPGRDARNIEFEITAITDDPKDPEGLDMKQKGLGILIYYRMVGGTGGGISSLDYANQNFSKSSPQGNIIF